MSTSFLSTKRVSGRGAGSLFMLSLLAASVHAFDSGSTGADGALNPTVNTEIVLPPSGILNYTTINIPAGVTVTFKKNTANTPVHLLATGDVTIAGTLDLRGGTAKPTGTYGDGLLGDDGVPGVGGPGGFDGGRGGRDDAALRAEIIRGGAGLGPGGGPGGIDGNDGCSAIGYYKYVGVGGGYAENAYQTSSTNNCQTPGSITLIGKTYGSALLRPLLGGSGGGGGRGSISYPGSGGGGGGGAILIASSGKITLTGTIDTTGGDGGGVLGTGVGGQGAGGSGGGIRVIATSFAGNGRLYANGGCRHESNLPRRGCGNDGWGSKYGGSPGRIRVEAEAVTFNGTSEPAYSVDVPGPVFIAEAPSLRIASVAGQNVPANPTGNADVALPGTTTGPIDVTFQTSNVPVGNTVRLRVVPAYGLPIEVLSPAISGSTASGTASVQVTLPQGPSTLQATTSYTIVIADRFDLSRFAEGERVATAEVTVPLDGEPTARLLTVSGKAFDISYQTLRALGVGV